MYAQKHSRSSKASLYSDDTVTSSIALTYPHRPSPRRSLKPAIASKHYGFTPSALLAKAGIMPKTAASSKSSGNRIVQGTGTVVVGHEDVNKAKVPVSALDIVQTETKGIVFIKNAGQMPNFPRFGGKKVTPHSRTARSLQFRSSSSPAPTPSTISTNATSHPHGPLQNRRRPFRDHRHWWRPRHAPPTTRRVPRAEKTHMATIVLANHLDELERAIDDGVIVIKACSSLRGSCDGTRACDAC